MNYYEKSMKNNVLQIFIVFLCFQGVASAATEYVSDQLVITLRAGQGDQYRIIQTLRSGTALEILEEADPFAKVRTPNGNEGWVRRQYLQDKPTSKILLDEITGKYERANTDNKRLSEELANLKKEHAALNKEHQRFVQDNKALRKENVHLNQLASRPRELEQENQFLKAESVKIKQENDRLKSENDEYRESTAQKWFMSGSAVLLFGVLLGLWLPKMRKRKSSAWQ